MASGSTDETGMPSHLAPPHYSPPSPIHTAHAPAAYVQQAAIAGLRAQILDNATVLFPFIPLRLSGPNEPRTPQLVIAKTPRDRPQQQKHKDGRQEKHLDDQPDEQADQASASKQPAKSGFSKAFKLGAKDDKTKVDKDEAAQAFQAEVAAWPPESYYALLLRLSVDDHVVKPRVLLRGDPRDTVAQALEHLLELTEEKMHERYYSGWLQI